MPVLVVKCSLRLCCADMAYLQSAAGTIGWMNPAGDSVSASEFDTEFPVPCACVCSYYYCLVLITTWVSFAGVVSWLGLRV